MCSCGGAVNRPISSRQGSTKASGWCVSSDVRARIPVSDDGRFRCFGLQSLRWALASFSSIGTLRARRHTADLGARGLVSLGTHHDDRGGGVQLDVGAIVTVADRIRSAIETVIEGKPEVLRITLTTLLAEGHLL